MMTGKEHHTIQYSIFNNHCYDIMAKYDQGHFDLAIVDPPYGLKWGKTGFVKDTVLGQNLDALQEWDKPPDLYYFQELRRVSKEQIIWGGNYFLNILGKTVAPIIWYKRNGANYYADGEFAWTSFENGTLRVFDHQWCGAFKDSERGEKAFHPTQKPIELYKWIMAKYCEKGYKILDTHLGSGSSICAGLDMDFHVTGIEINEEYYDKALVRIKDRASQLKLF